MARRKKPISLAPVPSLTRAAAVRALRKFSATGYRQPEGPTPERILQSSGGAAIETFSESVEVYRDGQIEPDAIDLTRVRIDDSVLGKLKSRSLLNQGKSEDEAGLNLVFFEAGSKYYELWYRAGLQPLGAAQLEPAATPGFSGKCFFKCEAQVIAFDDFRAARRCMAQEFAAVVDAIVLKDYTPETAGRIASGYAARQHANAVGMFALRGGLRQLAYHFKLLSHSDVPKGGAA